MAEQGLAQGMWSIEPEDLVLHPYVVSYPYQLRMDGMVQWVQYYVCLSNHRPTCQEPSFGQQLQVLSSPGFFILPPLTRRNSVPHLCRGLREQLALAITPSCST